MTEPQQPDRPMSIVERLTHSAARDPKQVPMLADALVRAELIVFGSVQDRGEQTGTAELDILHYLSGTDQVMPVFTDERYAELAAREDESIVRLQAITVRGLELLERVTDSVQILVNAWSDVETEVSAAELRRAAAALRGTAPPPAQP